MRYPSCCGDCQQGARPCTCNRPLAEWPSDGLCIAVAVAAALAGLVAALV